MKKRKTASILCATILALNAVNTLPANVFAADYVAAKQRVSVHDPSIIRDPQTGTYYAFGSHIDAAKSTDLQSWKLFTNGYARQNNKVFGDLSGNLKKAFAWAGEDLGDCKGGFAVWAPDVIWNPDYRNSDGSKGAYVIYFCTSSDYRTSVICYAVSQQIEGPYTFVDTLIYSGFTDTDSYWSSSTKNVNRRYSSTNIPDLINAGKVTINSQWFNKHNFNNQLFPNAIDPTIYYDTDGKMYMCYGSWSGGIFTLEIDKETGQCIHPQTGTTADGRMVDSYFGTKISGGYGKSGEGPFIEYNQDTGFYYLWVTYGGLTSTGGYNMRVGRSRSPLGPFTDAAGRNMVLESSTNLDSIGQKVMTNYKFDSLPRAYMACGHNSVLHDDDGQWYLVNHARFDDGSEYHEVRVHAMNFNEAGWPVVMPYEYSGETWSDAGFQTAELAGTFEFINHGNATNGTITQSSKITLNADGTISGAATGTWFESSDSAAATFTINNVTYTGFFNPQYDESGKSNLVMTFTAAGNNNQSIWGVKTGTWTGKERNTLYNHYGSGRLFYQDQTRANPEPNAVYIGETNLLSDLPYTITNVNSGLVLESAPDQEENAAIQQWAKRGNKSGDKNQDFRLVDAGEGYCYLVSMVNENECITVNGNDAENGLEVSLQENKQADNQKWKLLKSGEYYAIVAKSAGDAAGLDVYEWSKENGGAIKQWEFWGGECQLWKIMPTYAFVPEGTYTFRNVSNGNYLGVDDNGTLMQNDGTLSDYNPIIWKLKTESDSFSFNFYDYCGRLLKSNQNQLELQNTENGSKETVFRIWGNADGTYSILSENDLAVTAELTGGYTLTTFTGATAQKFIPVHTKSKEVEHPEKRLVGDADCNTEVDVKDAVLIARVVSNDPDADISDLGKQNSDCNTDGLTTKDDLILLLMHLAKQITLNN